ncbi:MAG TPA: hypothetical protein VD816_09375 [Ohtaekwangia sp.]|nr:hypothetical protein [Ohtaekwangia sp.]
MNNAFSFRNIVLMCFLATMGIHGHAQHQLDTLKKRFDTFRNKNYQEKIYLHISQPELLTGETLHFKAYVTDGASHQLSDLSKVAYVEILDQKNTPVLQAKINITQGIGSGSLYLSPIINSGNYFIRAYTNWMKNFGAEFYFHKAITIINPFTKLEVANAVTKKARYDAQFLPEGGSLLADVPNNIGFRVTDESGKGAAFDGYVIDLNGDTVAHFKPLKFGIGRFAFTAQKAITYKAVIKNAAGEVFTVPFPSAAAHGYGLQVYDSANDLKIIVHGRPMYPVPAPVYLLVHTRNSVSHLHWENLGQNSTRVVIPKDQLQDGISHITLFNAALQPVCERLFFKQPRQLSIAVQANQSQYDNRRPVRLSLTTSGKEKTIPANLSVAVYKKDSLTGIPAGTLPDYLWLTSDLKGTIESPEFYLSNTEEAAQAIDNLMLTHGWRRFRWPEALQQKQPALKHVPEFRGHIIHGVVRNDEGQPVPGSIVYLSAPSKVPYVFASRSNPSGEVLFEVKRFWGPQKIVVQTHLNRDSLSRVEIMSPFSNAYASLALPAFAPTSRIRHTLLSRSLAMQVEDVYHREQQEKFAAPVSDSLAFYGLADERYYLDAFTRFPVMEEVMREYVPGVLVRIRKDGFHFMVADHTNKAVFRETPFILLDGVPIFDADEIMALDPRRVRKLEVVTHPYYLGVLSLPGIVSYTTYAGDLSGFQLRPACVVMDYEGLQLQREFYSPQYDSQKKRESRLPDQRVLLYWDAHVTTGPDGQSELNFYTGDLDGEYQVVVEGMTGDGVAGTGVTTFKVQRIDN